MVCIKEHDFIHSTKAGTRATKGVGACMCVDGVGVRCTESNTKRICRQGAEHHHPNLDAGTCVSTATNFTIGCCQPHIQTHVFTL